MLVTLLGLVVVLAAAFFVAWPLFSATEFEDRTTATTATDEASPEHDKEQALLAIRDADFDHRVGKLSDEDYGVLRAELEARAFSAMAALDSAAALHSLSPGPAAPAATTAPRAAAEPGGFCPSCGVRFSRGARFCPGCGKKLPSATQRGRRRA